MLLVKKTSKVHYLTQQPKQPKKEKQPKKQTNKMCYSNHSLPRKNKKKTTHQTKQPNTQSENILETQSFF
jgi:hypothetical protein